MLNEALRLLRRYHGVSQKDLAEQLGISRSYLCEIEGGEKGSPITVALLERYSQVFDIPVSTILLFSEQMVPGKRAEKLRVAMASKLVRLLAWVDEQAETDAKA